MVIVAFAISQFNLSSITKKIQTFIFVLCSLILPFLFLKKEIYPNLI